MEEVEEFKHPGTVWSKGGGKEGEVSERVVKGGIVIGAISRVMNAKKTTHGSEQRIKEQVSPSTDTWTGDLETE